MVSINNENKDIAIIIAGFLEAYRPGVSVWRTHSEYARANSGWNIVAYQTDTLASEVAKALERRDILTQCHNPQDLEEDVYPYSILNSARNVFLLQLNGECLKGDNMHLAVSAATRQNSSVIATFLRRKAPEGLMEVLSKAGYATKLCEENKGAQKIEVNKEGELWIFPRKELIVKT